MKFHLVLSIILALLTITQGQETSTNIIFPPEPTGKPTILPPTPTTTPSTTTPSTTTAIPTTTAPTTTPTTTTPTTTTPTTTTPTTTTPTTTTPTTTTPTPKTTTSPSTTPTPIPTTNKPKTTTIPSTTVPTTTTVAPKPNLPEIGTWNVTIGNNTCILVKLSIHLNVSYNTTEKKIAQTLIHVPADATASGLCGNITQNMTIIWPGNGTKNNSVYMSFKKNDTLKHFVMESILATLVPDKEHFPNASSDALISIKHAHSEFTTPLQMSYKCNRNESLILVNEGQAPNSTLIVSHLQIEAFRNSNSSVFSSAEDCEDSGTPGIVPIAVGCALGALIIIVLVVYLIGRRRSQARGYLSM